MRLSFVLSHVPNPRMNKRIGLLKQHFDVSLICWNRKSLEIWKQSHKDIDTTEISIQSNYGNPIKRVLPTVKYAKEVIKNLNERNPEIVYTSNLDMLLVVSLYAIFKKNKPKIIYEIADIHHLLIDKPKSLVKKGLGFILKLLDKVLCKNISLLVLTSEKYYENYFNDFVPASKVIFVPNMPNLLAFQNYKPKKHEIFTVGFIGAIRYKDQMKMLINAAKKCGVNIIFAGAGLDGEIESLCKNESNIQYLGRYDYDSEIANLYGKVDCIYSVYDADLNNVRSALPNKLYESIYCELPIIVAKTTYLAELVEKMGVGLAVSHKKQHELEAALSRLSTDKEFYNCFKSSCNIYKKTINIDHYNERLLKRIRDLSE